MTRKDLVIIGGGSAGLSSALEAYKLGIKDILIIEKDDCLGGILNQCIHNGFGLIEYNEELTGPEFLSRLEEKIDELHIEYKLSTAVIKIDRDLSLTYSNSIEGIKTIKAKALIYAAGCFERTAGMIKLSGDRVSGITTAGVAQKYLNIYGYLVGKSVVILGSGDIGLIMARRLTLEGAKVICVAEIMPYSNGLNRNIVQCLNDFDIPLYLSTTVKEVKGKDRVEKVILSKVDDKGNIIPNTEKEIECDTLILSIGLLPYVGLIRNLKLDKDNLGKIKVNQYNLSSVDGFFLAGNCLHVHDVVDYVVKEARQSSLGAYLYLNNKFKKDYIDVKCSSNISYCLPQIIDLSIKDDINIKLRVKNPVKDCFILIKNGEDIVQKNYYLALLPSEMVIIDIKKEKMMNMKHEDLIVELVEK